ncbi:MAG: nucleotidyltransferase family protein [Acidobacteriota bacterium]
MKAAAIILAAGESRRMGRPKALLPFRGGTFLSVLAETLAVSCSTVIAVFGYDGENVSRSAPAAVITTVNPDYRLGMLTSLQAGLRACPDDAGVVLFTLVDHPAVTPETVAALTRTGADIAIPRYRGQRGHPVLMRRAIALEYLAEPLTSKVRDVIDRHPDSIRYIEVDDPALYEALLAREALRS